MLWLIYRVNPGIYDGFMSNEMFDNSRSIRANGPNKVIKDNKMKDIGVCGIKWLKRKISFRGKLLYNLEWKGGLEFR